MTNIVTPPLPRLRFYRKKRYWIPVVTLLVMIAVVWIYLDIWTTKYVNRVLGTIPGYQGSVSDVNVHLYRGAYQIHDLKLSKLNGKIPTPFIDIKLVDLSVQWGALIHGRIVSDIELDQPVLNFAKAKNGAKQTGKETDWTTPIKKLTPIDINKVTMKQGEIHYKDFSADPKVDLFVKNLNGEMTNLRNVEKKGEKLPSTIHGTGTSIGDGKLSLDGKLNVLREIPDMDLAGKLENAHLPAINNYAEKFAAINFEKGELNVYTKFTVKNSYLSGYVKPIATNIHIISMKHAANPVQYVWEAFVGGVVEIFSNQRKDQFATQINLQGSLNKPDTDVWSTLGGILHNAFVQALSKDVKNDLGIESTPKTQN